MQSSTIVFWMAWGLIFYTYAGFPLLLALCARFFGKPPSNSGANDDAEHLPRVAMVVAAHNEEEVLVAKLANTWMIDYPADRFQLYVGSDGSADATAEILTQDDDPRLVRLLFSERRGKVSVLDDLVRTIDAEILVMSDASTMYAPDAVRKMVRHFRDPHVGCVTGELSIRRQGDVSGEGAYLRYERWLKRNESRLGCVIGCVGAIFAVRRDLYEPLPASTIVEDFVLCLRVLERGYRSISDPEACATDPPCTTVREEMQRKIRIGAGGFQAIGLTRRVLHPRYGLCAFSYFGHKVLRWLVPFFFLIAVAANATLLQHRFYQATLALQVAGGALAYWVYRAEPGQQRPRWTRPFGYFYLMNYALFRGFLRFALNTQKVTWIEPRR